MDVHSVFIDQTCSYGRALTDSTMRWSWGESTRFKVGARSSWYLSDFTYGLRPSPTHWRSKITLGGFAIATLVYSGRRRADNTEPRASKAVASANRSIAELPVFGRRLGEEISISFLASPDPALASAKTLSPRMSELNFTSILTSPFASAVTRRCTFDPPMVIRTDSPGRKPVATIVTR